MVRSSRTNGACNQLNESILQNPHATNGTRSNGLEQHQQNQSLLFAVLTSALSALLHKQTASHQE